MTNVEMATQSVSETEALLRAANNGLPFDSTSDGEAASEEGSVFVTEDTADHAA